MDISKNSLTSSSSDKNSMALPLSERDIFFASYYPNQEWSLPDSIIYYITKNPSTPKCYQKMIQSCKHFFIKNPILIISELFFSEYQTRFNEEKVNFSKVVSKIWGINELLIIGYNSPNQNFVSSIIPKFYQSDIKILKIYKQNLAFKDLKFLASKCEEADFNKLYVINDDNSVVALEEIFQIFPCIKYFRYWFGDNAFTGVTSKTVPELLKMPHFSNHLIFELAGISENFNIECFYDFIKKNKNVKIRLVFPNNISDAYTTRLQAVVNEIIEEKHPDFRIPYINFFGMIPDSHKILYERYLKH